MYLSLFPVELVRSKLLTFLTIKDLARLDTSTLNHRDRQHLYAAYSECIIGEEVLVDDCLFTWLEMRNITPEKLKFLESVVDRPVLMVRNAKAIHLDNGCQFTLSTIVSMLQQSKNLQSFSYEALCIPESEERLTDEAVEQISASCPHLQEIQLGNHQLLTDSSLRSLASNCCKLRSVQISRCRSVSDDGIGWLVSRCPHLEHLNFNYCIQLTDATLLTIAAHATQLKTLLVEGLGLITHDAAVQVWSALPGLTRVGLSFCSRLNEQTLIQLVHRCHQLESVTMEGYLGLQDHAMQEIAKYCKKLHTVNISKSGVTAGAVQALVTECPQLQRLYMDSCGTITDEAVISIAQHCPQLLELDIAACTRITQPASLVELARSCPHLQVLCLDIVPKAVTDELLNALCENCPDLRHLSVHWCNRVSEEAINRMQAQYGKKLRIRLPEKSPFFFA